MSNDPAPLLDEAEAILKGKPPAKGFLNRVFGPSRTKEVDDLLDRSATLIEALASQQQSSFAERYYLYRCLNLIERGVRDRAFDFLAKVIEINPHPEYEELKRKIMQLEPINASRFLSEKKQRDIADAKLSPLKPGSLFRATIDPVASTGLQVTVQLSTEARKVINKGLWDYSLGEIHNWYYNYEVKTYNEAWMRYDINEKHKTSNKVEKPTLPKPKKTRPVLIKELCNPKGYTCYFDTIADAKDGAEQLRTMLQRLKSFIEDNQAPQQKKLTFDL